MNPGQMAMELRLAICNLTALANLPPRRVCSVGSFASRRGQSCCFSELGLQSQNSFFRIVGLAKRRNLNMQGGDTWGSI
jgi:hypothetical protein